MITARATKIAVRPLDNAELERGTDRLRTLIYPDHPEAYETGWHALVWRWLGTHPLADQLHRWVLASEENEVVGHLAAVPLYYRVGGERVVAHTPADYQVLPGHGFHALSLMRRFPHRRELRLGGPGAGGNGRGDAPRGQGGGQAAVRGEDNGRLRAPEGPEAAEAGDEIPNLGLRTLNAALGGVFAPGPEPEVLDGFDASFDDLFESVAAALPCVPEKDAAFLRWRYGPDSPQHPVTVLGVRDGETLLGYAVLRITREGDNGYLLDLTTRPRRGGQVAPEGRDPALRASGVYIIRYRSSRPSRRDQGPVEAGLLLPQRAAPHSAGQVRGPRDNTRWLSIPPTGHTTPVTARCLSGLDRVRR